MYLEIGQQGYKELVGILLSATCPVLLLQSTDTQLLPLELIALLRQDPQRRTPPVHISILYCQAEDSQWKLVDSFHNSGGHMEKCNAYNRPSVILVYQTMLSTYTC